jgi:hypothetical protein
LSWGAAAFAQGLLSEPGKEAYKALKEALLRIISLSDVEKLEQNPNSEHRKGAIAEELEKAGQAEDPELTRLAQALVTELKEVGAAGGAIGFSLEEVEAINVRLRNITARDTGVSIKKSKFAGNIEASDVSAGVQPLGKPERR